jgi:hypothetical protein
MKETILVKVESVEIAITFSFPLEETWCIASVRDAQGRFAAIAPWYEGAKLTSLWDAICEYFEEWD